MEELVKVETAAKLLGLSLQGTWRAAREGLIPCVRIGRHMRFSPSVLQEWAKSQATTQQATAVQK